MVKIFLLVFIFSACSENPKRAKFPGAEGKTVGIGSDVDSKALLGGFDAASKAIPVLKKQETLNLSIKINLKKELNLPAKFILFAAIKSEQIARPVAAVKKIGFKIPGEINFTVNNLLGQNVPPGPYELSIRVDQDGDPLTWDDGDIYYTGPVENLSSKLELTLSEVY